MKSIKPRSIVNVAVGAAAVMAFFAFAPASIVAQQRRSTPGLPSDAETRARAERQETLDIERERLLRDSNSTAKPIDQRKVQTVAAQIKEDFERLAIIGGELTTGKLETGSGAPYQFFLLRLNEVKSRALRLQKTLSLPKAEVDEGIAKIHMARNQTELRAILNLLNNKIVGFVTNDYFKNPKVFDADLLRRASSDLETIIELSRNVKKSTEKLEQDPK